MNIYLANIVDLISNHEKEYSYSTLTLNRLKKTKIIKRINEIKATELLFSLIYKDLEFLTISRTKNGKPYFNEINEKFSYSHSEKYIVTITDKHEVGIDIQKILEKTRKVARAYLDEEEITLPSNDIEYTLLWSIKEAVLKKLDLTLFDLKEIKIISVVRDDNEFLTKAKYKNRNIVVRTKLFEDYLISYTSSKKIDLTLIN